MDIGAVEVGASDNVAPKVVDVLLNGVQVGDSTPWASLISFADLVPIGKQLAPIYRYGTNEIDIVFSEAVTVDSGAFTLFKSGTQRGGSVGTLTPYSITYPTANTARLTFSSPLPSDRYRLDIEASKLHDGAGHALDGYWENQTSGTLYDWTDDPTLRPFETGTGMPGTTFEFLFALLPGDYNQNGIIDVGDPAKLADGTGDGIVDTNDYDLWLAQDGLFLWFQRFQGDYNTDGKVDYQDYFVWRMKYGNTLVPGHPEYTSADGSGDGIVDAADYVAWALWNTTIGAWDIDANGLAVGRMLVESTNAPLRIVGYNTAHVPTLVDFSYDAATFTATWRFENLTANDNYIISLSDAVTNTQGYRLDGEWGNPGIVNTSPAYGAGSTFPSGDGHAGGDFNFVLTLLAGDANRDGCVDEADYDIIQSHLDGSGGFEDGDFNGDGLVDATDMAIWELNQGLFRTGGIMLPSDIAGEGGWDWRIDDQDLAVIAAHFGMTGATRDDGDITGDGNVDIADLDFLMAQYGFTVQMNI